MHIDIMDIGEDYWFGLFDPNGRLLKTGDYRVVKMRMLQYAREVVWC